jgi:hypothetical protein
MNNTTCNGWRNRETWLVNLWFMDGVDEPMSADDIQSMVEEAIEEALSGAGSMRGFLTDMMDVGCIDWDELAQHTAAE